MKKVCLGVTPLSEGYLGISGVQWRVQGEDRFAQGEIQLSLDKKKSTQNDRKKKTKHLPPHQRVNFRVVKSFPRVNGEFQGLPSVTIQGQIHLFSLELTNLSDMEAKV
jgi:hypothetical protein